MIKSASADGSRNWAGQLRVNLSTLARIYCFNDQFLLLLYA